MSKHVNVNTVGGCAMEAIVDAHLSGLCTTWDDGTMLVTPGRELDFAWHAGAAAGYAFRCAELAMTSP